MALQLRHQATTPVAANRRARTDESANNRGEHQHTPKQLYATPWRIRLSSSALASDKSTYGSTADGKANEVHQNGHRHGLRRP